MLLVQLPYHIIFIIISILAIFENKNFNFYLKYKSFFKLFGLSIILFFMGLKYHVGGDWGSYLNYFNDVSSGNIQIRNFSNDIGWYALNYITIKLNLPFATLNTVAAIIFLIGIHSNAKLYANYWLFYLILTPYFIFIVGMGYTRQSISIGLLLISISYLLKESNIKTFLIFLILILIGSLFHKSILLFTVLPLLIMKINIFKLCILILTLYLFFLLTFFLLLDGNIFRRILYFFESSYSSFGAYLRTLILSILAFFNLLVVNKFEQNSLKLRFNKNFSILLLIISFLIFLSPSTVIIDRLLLYFHILFSSSLLTIYEYSKNQFNRNFILNLMIFLGFAFLIIWFSFAENSFSWLPYQNYILMMF